MWTQVRSRIARRRYQIAPCQRAVLFPSGRDLSSATVTVIRNLRTWRQASLCCSGRRLSTRVVSLASLRASQSHSLHRRQFPCNSRYWALLCEEFAGVKHSLPFQSSFQEAEINTCAPVLENSQTPSSRRTTAQLHSFIDAPLPSQQAVNGLPM